jgi:hypothetical protein
MFMLAAEQTAQVMAPGVAGVSEEKDPAMPATTQAFAQVRLGPQDRSQEHVILQNQRPDVLLPVPSRPELKELRDRYCKKPKLSLRMLTLLLVTSSYPIAAPCVENVGRGLLLWRFASGVRKPSLEKRIAPAAATAPAAQRRVNLPIYLSKTPQFS